MIKEISRVAKHTATYGVGVVLSKAVGFLMIPVYTHHLVPADYGTLELLDDDFVATELIMVPALVSPEPSVTNLTRVPSPAGRLPEDRPWVGPA